VEASFPDTSATEQLERDVELQRLGKLLGIAHTELHYLQEVTSGELRALRDQVTATLFDSSGAVGRLAAATKILPAALVASLAQKAFGPALAARVAGQLDPDRAVDVAGRLPVSFLAELATELDPRQAAAILTEIPAPIVAAVTRELIARQEWVAMGAFYGYLPDEAIRAAMAEADPHARLHIALVLEDRSRLARVLEIAGPDALAQITEQAAAEGLSDQLRALESYLTPEQRAQLPG
jgi:hypothetical protein